MRYYLQSACMILLILLLSTSCLQSADYKHIERGDLLQEKGKIKEAITEYQKGIKENPEFAYTYKKLGSLYYHKLKNHDKALEVYLKGLQVEPNNYGLNLDVMYVYFDLKDIDNGLKYYELLSELRDESKRYSFPRDIIPILLINKTNEDKIEVCNKYLLINPSDLILREVLVEIYKDQRKYKQAEYELEMMLKYGRETSSVYFDLGTCNYHLGRPQKALEYFKKAEELGAYVPKEFYEKLHLMDKGPHPGPP